MDQQRLLLRVRIESGIPKLLVKINPCEAEGFSAKNLGEVKLRKASAHRGHVAVLHMSYGIPPGELVMSLKLAEILDVEEEEMVELTAALAAAQGSSGATTDSSTAPATSTQAPSSTTTTEFRSSAEPSRGIDPLTSASRRASRSSVNSTEEKSWFSKSEAKYPELPRRPSLGADSRFGAYDLGGADARGQQPAAKSGRESPFEFDWIRSLEVDQDAPSWRRSRSALLSSDQRHEQSASTGKNRVSLPPGSMPAVSPGDSSQRSSESAAPEWLRDLRAFAEWDLREVSYPSGEASGFAGSRSTGQTTSFSSSLGERGFRHSASAEVPGAGREHRTSSLKSGGAHTSSSTPWYNTSSSNSRSFGASSGDVSKGVASANLSGESIHGSRAKDDDFLHSGRHEARSSDGVSRLSEESWPRWPFNFNGEDDGPFSASLGAGARGFSGRSAKESADVLHSVPSVPAEVDSLPTSESSDDGLRKAAGVHRQRRSSDGVHKVTGVEAARPTAADDLGLGLSDLGGLSAAADLGAATVDWRRSLERVAAECKWNLGTEEAQKRGSSEDLSGRQHDAFFSNTTAHTSSVWDAPTPQRAGTSGQGQAVPSPAAAESLEPSPAHTPCEASHASSRTSSEQSHGSSGSNERGRVLPPNGNQPVRINSKSKTLSEAFEKASSLEASEHTSAPTSSPRERNEPSSSSPPTSSPRETACDQANVTCSRGPPRSIEPESCRIVPIFDSKAQANAQSSKRQSVLLTRKAVTLGSLSAVDEEPFELTDRQGETRQPLSSRWRPPSDTGGGGLERSELGSEVTAEVKMWLVGETSGRQCSQVVLDRALTVLANFKLASGCQLEVLGGPLGAIVGGYNDADWLHDEVFRKQPGEAIREAFMLLGFRGRADGDWSNIASEEVSLAYRRLCLRGHPSRGGAPRGYLKLQVAMELIRAFSGEAGPLEATYSRTPRAKDRTPTATPSGSCHGDCTPSSRFGMGRSSSKGNCAETFVLNDVTLVRELQLTAAQAEEEAAKISQEHLEEMNRALDEYILRQMCFKSEIVDEIARLHEDCAYAILGVSSDATDGEIKKAYRLIAMQCHPDKGGDKEDFQELNNAYEKIMEQRRSTNDPFGKNQGGDENSEDEKPEKEAPAPKKEREKEKGDKKDDETTENTEGDNDGEQTAESVPEGEDDEYGEEGSNASLIEKASKAAEEASRYAKTAAEFAHQAAEAAETARRGREQGSRDTLTKSIAHSAIVLTLTVVKAVRVVGYATLDVAAQCRIASKRNPNALGCAERAVSAMSLGLEALNAALACAEVTETTAAELQTPSPANEGDSAAAATAAAERFVGAAVRASLAAASASNAAMAAAIAAVEGSRECMKAVEDQSSNGDGDKGDERNGEEGADWTGECGDEVEAEEDGRPPEPKPARPPPPTPEEAAAAATRRLVAQRNNNHKVLQRLNAEILGHQQNVKQFLSANRQLIPTVSSEAKKKVFSLLQDYAVEARAELESFALDAVDAEDIVNAMREQSMLTPFAQEQAVAIPVSVKARVLKMAALYDQSLATQVLDREIFSPVRTLLGDGVALEKFETLCRRIQEEVKGTT